MKLPYGFEASLSSIVRSYLLGGSPTATIVSTLPQVFKESIFVPVESVNFLLAETLHVAFIRHTSYISFALLSLGLQENELVDVRVLKNLIDVGIYINIYTII